MDAREETTIFVCPPLQLRRRVDNIYIMNIVEQIKQASKETIEKLYGLSLAEKDIQVNDTKPEFEGDYTLVLFSFIKQLKKSPEQLGNEIGELLIKNYSALFSSYNIIKGFLNITVKDSFWIEFLQNNYANSDYGKKKPSGQKVMVEYSSPNTNKPLHLGHLRNNFLGWSIAEILNACGHEVVKTCIVNDRGIHICKSMIAWQLFSNGETPEIAGKKGDHFVGDYYVKFNDEYKKQVQELTENGRSKEDAEKEAPIMKAAQKMLLDWEAGNKEVKELWSKMNSWVYKGFEVTYNRIGSDFAKSYYESETYLLGKKFVEDGLKQNVFFKKDDGSVWIDLTEDGLDEKLVLRKDGTSVYITQDLGLAQEKFDDLHYNQSIYVVGDEQNYHFKVLKLILQKLKKPYADGVYHLSYGMVELPTGRMKSREGTVVDADEMIDEMVSISAKHTEELGKVKDFSDQELKVLYDTIGLGALKFFLLRVDPKKKMIFNPEESIDFHGFTGPFVQYTHARIKSILKKEQVESTTLQASGLLALEKKLLIKLEQYPRVIEQAAQDHNPSVLAIYAFEVAKIYNSFYTEHSVMNAENEEKKQLRLRLCELTAKVIASSMGMLGINVPERM
jgi:arginyl-tRNA synthetase